MSDPPIALFDLSSLVTLCLIGGLYILHYFFKR